MACVPHRTGLLKGCRLCPVILLILITISCTCVDFKRKRGPEKLLLTKQTLDYTLLHTGMVETILSITKTKMGAMVSHLDNHIKMVKDT